jgi:hypothetical protein
MPLGHFVRKTIRLMDDFMYPVSGKKMIRR